MAQQPMPGSSTEERFLEPGEEVQLDIKVFADNSKARKHKRAIGGYTCALTVVDLATGFKLGYVLKHTAHLETTLEEIRLEIYAIENRILKVIRLDNQFITKPIKLWAMALDNTIEFKPCIPYEHHSIGDIERFNRTLEDGIVKFLYGKPHLNISYWGYAYKDFIMHGVYNLALINKL